MKKRRAIFGNKPDMATPNLGDEPDVVESHPPVKASKLAPNELGDAVARIAEGEVGVREEPADSNRGPRVELYQSADWLSSETAYAYCASFVDWCVQQAIEFTPVPWDRPRTAGAWDLERWADEQGLSIIRRPGASAIRRGDIIVFTFSHCGIATGSPIGGIVPTVEANTTAGSGTLAQQRDGGGVYARERDLSLVRSRIRLSI